MNQADILRSLQAALVAVRAGDRRTARRHLSPLAVVRMSGSAYVPRATWWLTLLERNQLKEVENGLVAELETAQAGPYAFVSTRDLLQAAHAVYGGPGLVAAGIASLHELDALSRPGAPLGPAEPLLRARLLTLLAARPAA